MVGVLALLATAAALFVGMRFGPVSPVVAAAGEDVLVLNGLESMADIARFAYQSYNVDFSLFDGECTEGEHSCLAQFLRGYDPIREPIGFECNYDFGGFAAKDWSNYRFFRVDVYNREAGPIRLAIKLANGREGVTTDFQVAPRRWVTLELALAPLASKGLNLKQVTAIVFLEPANTVEATLSLIHI